MLADDPPNQRPTPEVVTVQLREVALKYKRTPRPFVGLYDVRHREVGWLIKKRGLPPERIALMLDEISASVGFGDSDRIGQHLKLLGQEKDAFRIRQIRPIDRTKEDQRRLNRARDNARQKAKRQATKGLSMSIDELQSGAIIGALDHETWRSARDVDGLLAGCPAFKNVATRASRKAIIRRAFGKLAAADLIEIEDQIGQNGIATHARLLHARGGVH
jgi:hypothetical protein